MQLEPCPSCQRHVRTDETVCPFCAASVETALATRSPRMLPDRRLGRAALVSFGLTVAAVGGAAPLQGCGDDGSDDVGMNEVPVYGAPAQPDKDAGKEQTKDAGRPNVLPMYGGSPQPIERDAGNALDGGKSDAGGSDASRTDAGDAGDAGPTDAAVRDADPGRVVAVYGAPAQQK